MKNRFLFILAVATIVVFSAGNAFADKAEEIIEKYLKTAGIEKVDEMKTLKAEMTTTAMGMSMKMKMFSIMPDFTRVEMNVMGQDIISVVNDKGAWMMQGGNVIDVPDDQVGQIRDQMEQQNAFLDHTFVNWKEKGIKITYEGTEDVDGVPTDKIKAVEGEETSFYCFDKKNHQLLKVTSKQDMMGQMTDMDLFMKDYKKIDDVMIPHKIVMISNGTEMANVIVNKIEFNVDIDKSIFNKP